MTSDSSPPNLLEALANWRSERLHKHIPQLEMDLAQSSLNSINMYWCQLCATSDQAQSFPSQTLRFGEGQGGHSTTDWQPHYSVMTTLTEDMAASWGHTAPNPMDGSRKASLGVSKGNQHTLLDLEQTKPSLSKLICPESDSCVRGWTGMASPTSQRKRQTPRKWRECLLQLHTGSLPGEEHQTSQSRTSQHPLTG